jgi:hypothetical protein
VRLLRFRQWRLGGPIEKRCRRGVTPATLNNLYRKQTEVSVKRTVIDDRLTFYGLQAHFFSEDAEVIHGRLSVCSQSGSGPEDGEVERLLKRTGTESRERRSSLTRRAEWA